MGTIKEKHSLKRVYLLSFDTTHVKTEKKLIVMYDIPHEHKKIRDWFRRHLIRFGFEMIQKSVWVGPGPLPKDFTTYVKSLKLGDRFKTFALAKSYTGGQGL